MLFSELYKIMVNKVNVARFKRVDHLPLDPALSTRVSKCEQYFILSSSVTAFSFIFGNCDNMFRLSTHILLITL